MESPDFIRNHMSHQVTARVDDDLYAEIIAVSDEINGTKADAMRTLMRQGLEIDKIKQENKNLKDQLAATNQRIDDTKELVEYVEEERELQRQRQQKENAPVWKRAKWWVLGVPLED